MNDLGRENLDSQGSIESAAALNAEPILLREYDENWSLCFERERERLQMCFIDHPVNIVHIGSTAVRGVVAKPTIDLIIGIDENTPDVETLKRLVGAGYVYLPEFEQYNRDRRFLLRRDQYGNRAFHASVVPVGSMFWNRHLAFRDVLRENTTLATAYSPQKRPIAKRHPGDRRRYLEAKSPFIEACLMKHNRWLKS